MRPFRFRAQVVLELRRREEEAARAALARQQAETMRVRALADEAARTARTAQATLAATTAAGASPALLEWHRSWIVKLTRDVAVGLVAVAEAEQAAARAAVVLGTALQKRRVLERLRERALRRYRVDSDREQLKDMNQHASLRHFAQAPNLGGQPDDDQPHDRRHTGGSDHAVPDLESLAGRIGEGSARPGRVLEPAGDAVAASRSDPAAG